jgi:GNAT superfamily N-acetyltransferase
LQDTVVGVVAVQAEDGLGWIDQLMVHPQQVKRGIGRVLLARALRQLPRPVQLWTFQANWAARRFYDLQGWRAVAFTDGADNEERVPDVLYRLDPA